MTDEEFYYDIAKFEVQTLAQRNNILLVFHSMLFAGTVFISTRESFISPMMPIAFGLILSVVWMYLNALTQVIEERAMQKLLAVAPRVKDLFAARQSNRLLRRGSVSLIVAYIIPLLMFSGWLIILALAVMPEAGNATMVEPACQAQELPPRANEASAPG